MSNNNDGAIRVFVYGSLKSGFGNHGVLKGATFVEDAQLDGGYKMVSLGGFPGVIQVDDQEAVISGEVYEVDGSGLAALDMLEGNGSFYTRVKVKTNRGLRVWCYFLPESEYGEEMEVHDGIWLESWNSGLTA
jgi:gamma-glutamylaminecyclotransferase